jgi:DNA polymerase-3 subunit delta'
MSLPHLRGHEDARQILARAATAGNLPQSILLYGPEGIGKERVGLWLAQLLVCQAPSEEGPCGSCLPCRLVNRLEHPDVQWFFPLSRPDASSPEKLREKLEEARADELALRRENPFHTPAFDKAPAHFLGAIQTLQKLAGVRPAMGGRKVFVVGDADAMVPQESSPEAANAFLKLLEEPPADTTLILTTAQPGALLPTILSRVLPVRLAPLPENAVTGFLREAMELDPASAERIATLAQGAVGRALRLAPSGEGVGPLEDQRQAGRELLLTVLADGPATRLAAALAQTPSGARGDFSGELDALAGWLRDLLAVASGAPERVVNADGRAALERAVEQKQVHPLGITAALERVGRARELAAGNVNPQLILADLLRGIQTDLRSGEEAIFS